MDLLLGRFADSRFSGDRAADFEAFEALLDEPDGDIHHWLTSADSYQGRHRKLIEEIKAFHAN